MDEEKHYIESSAPTTEEAISKGLEELEAAQDEVEIEILDDGNRGLFGLGSREARVRLTLKTRSESPAERKSEKSPSSKPQPDREVEVQTEAKTEIKEPKLDFPPADEAEPQPERVETSADEEDDQEYLLAVSRETIEDLLEKMQIEAEVSVRFTPDSSSRNPNVLVEIMGDDLSILIGRRAETLNAIQYITRLIVGKELSRRVYLQVDVEGYRKRRERQLRRLARKMADQAINTGRTQMLEPMPPNERRLVHLELRDHPDVYTESVGEGKRRKVTVRLKD